MPEKRHSYVGPILLILFGVAMLLAQLDIWSFSWISLLRLWPVLLILFGLDMVLGRSRAGGVLLVIVAVGAIVAAAALLPAETSRGSRTSQRHAYSASDIETAEVDLKVGVARLDLNALQDSGNIIEAEVLYDKRTSDVDFSGEVHGGHAEITLKSHTRRAPWGLFGGGANEEWQVWLNPGIPIDLKIDAGVSDVNLDLEDLQLTRLEINAGVGELAVTLPRHGTYEATLDGGVGALTLYIPEGLEARIRVDGGLGSVDVAPRFEKDGRYYVTEGYHTADNRADIDIDGGVGAITIR